MIRRRATLLPGVVGLALLGAAAARVIYTSSGAGIVTLLIIGAVLLPRYLATQVECPAVRMWRTSSFFVAVVRRGRRAVFSGRSLWHYVTVIVTAR